MGVFVVNVRPHVCCASILPVNSAKISILLSLQSYSSTVVVRRGLLITFVRTYLKWLVPLLSLQWWDLLSTVHMLISEGASSPGFLYILLFHWLKVGFLWLCSHRFSAPQWLSEILVVLNRGPCAFTLPWVSALMQLVLACFLNLLCRPGQLESSAGWKYIMMFTTCLFSRLRKAGSTLTDGSPGQLQSLCLGWASWLCHS